MMYMHQRELTEAESLELAGLNAAVTEALKRRRLWLDNKMLECSSIKPGDPLYDFKSGQFLGRVTKLYRSWRNLDEGVLDTSHYCHYEYMTGPNSFTNTSSQPTLVVTNKRPLAS